jgi:hypothetical protein
MSTDDHAHVDPLPYWEKQIEIFHAIREKGMQAYADEASDLESAFELRDRTIRCIDEGTPGGIHIAGQGILMNQAQLADFCAKAQPDGVMSHEECGACSLYAKRENLDTADTDGYGKVWVAKLAEICAVPVKGHVAVAEMARPSGLHVARAAYYDGTGMFDPTRIPSLPQGFVISRAFLDPAYAKDEAKIAADIAIGAHGFGGLITAEEPFMLIAVAQKRGGGVPLDALLAELREVAAGYGGKVVVDGFAG